VATNKRDVELALRVKTDGTDDVQALAGDFDKLGAASKNAGEVGAAGLAALTARTKELRAAEAGASAELKASKQEYQQKRDAIDRLKASYQATGGDAAKYRQELGTLRLALVDAKAAIREKQEALNAASAAAKNAAGAERALTAQIKDGATQQAAAAKTASDQFNVMGAQLRQLRTIAAAALGGQLLGGLAGELSQTADAYQNLAARVKLATGEGAAFEASFAGVFEVAQRTNTAVEQTGALFTKIAQAGKAIGVSTADALRLTESINQAVQVSGTSAESSNAAIIQLVQGLQSGVLRGEEFNSVMEQAPRLAQALAEGLGVTTGELRKMAEAGKLTSATVIASLQGQSAVLQSEFDKLPATIGRALTNLSTSWTAYAGDVDAANGVSAKAAAAINVLAANLDTLGTVLLAAGKTLLALKAIDLAKVFFAQGAATTAATAATTANTAATIANTVAKQANAAAGDGAAASAGRFAGLLGSIKLGALALVLTNFREIGTAIGEGAARLVGYGKSIDAVETAWKAEEAATRASAAAKAAFAQQAQIAADKALGLSVEARKLFDEFEGLRLKGESTAEALAKLTKNLSVGDLKGISDAGAALDALALKGALSADQVRESWTRALKDIDLGVFRTEARAAFDESEQGARRFAAAMEGALRESIRRSGTDFQLISSGMGAAAQSALNDTEVLIAGLDRLKLSGEDAGRVLAASLNKAIDTADSQKAIEGVRLQIEAVRRVLGDKIADGFLDQAAAKASALKDALDNTTPGVNSLREAFRQLGLQAPEDLARTAAANKSAWETIKADGTAGADILKAAFARYAQSALDASGAAGTAGRETTQAMLQAEAAAKGLAVEFDNTGRVIVRGAFDASKGMEKLSGSIRQTTEDVKAQDAALQALYDRYRLVANTKTTADGFAKNADGSAAGTFNNNLPVDQAFGLVDSVKNGAQSSFTPEQARAAFAQAEAAFRDMQAFMKLNPGAASFEYQQSTTALYQGARAALDKVLSQNGLQPGVITNPNQSATPNATGTTAGAPRVVQINIAGVRSTVNVASEADSEALVGVLRQLGDARGTAA
jgi:tape measure domain-containing protein